jgi:GDP-fucose transporter C1
VLRTGDDHDVSTLNEDHHGTDSALSNKWVLNTSSLPLTFLLVQLTLSFVCLTVLSFLPPTHKFHFAPPRWNRQTIVAMVPVCTVNVVGLVFNTYCLQIVDASYFQVARGLTLPMTVVLQSVMNSEKPSTGTIVSCGLVTWGFTYSFLPHPHFAQSPIIEAASTAASRGEAPMLGMILGVFSAGMVAIHAVLIKSALKSIDNKTLDLAYWQNVLSALVLVVPVLLFGEFQGLMAMVTGGPGAEVYGDLSAFITGSLVTVSSDSSFSLAPIRLHR